MQSLEYIHVRKGLEARSLPHSDRPEVTVVREAAGSRISEAGRNGLRYPLPMQARVRLTVVIVGESLPLRQILVPTTFLDHRDFRKEVLAVRAAPVIEHSNRFLSRPCLVRRRWCCLVEHDLIAGTCNETGQVPNGLLHRYVRELVLLIALLGIRYGQCAGVRHTLMRTQR